MKTYSALFLCVAAAFSTSALANPIAVQNFSFEQPDLGHNTSATERFDTSSIPGWSANGSGGTGFGVADPSGNNYTGANGPVLPGTADGAQYAFLNLPSGFGNTLTYAGFSLGHFISGETYSLTVALGGRGDNGAPPNLYGITLLANGLAVGTSATAAGIADTFFDLTYTFTASDAQNGMDIGIALSANNTGTAFEQANFDNVRLSTTSVPEPSTILLSASIGMLAFFKQRREGRGKKAA